MTISQFIIHSRIGGHLGCFYLAVMNKAAYDHSCISSFVDVCFHFFLGKYLEVELLVYMVSVCMKTVFSRPVFGT